MGKCCQYYNDLKYIVTDKGLINFLYCPNCGHDLQAPEVVKEQMMNKITVNHIGVNQYELCVWHRDDIGDPYSFKITVNTLDELMQTLSTMANPTENY